MSAPGPEQVYLVNEAVAHRVCNLGDPKRPGIPMHFIRCDIAGNISKRYSATGLRFPEGTGSCAKWAVHNAFLTPSVIRRQYSVMPDGVTYFCFAKVAIQPAQGSVVYSYFYCDRHVADAILAQKQLRQRGPVRQAA